MRALALFILIPVLAGRAEEPSQTLAVLEFHSKLPKGEADSGYVTDAVRTAAKDAGGLRVKVMTRENMLVLLQASGRNLADCEGECEVETGRRIGADLVISGELLKFGSQYKVMMKLHQTRSGELLQGAQASGSTLDELDKNLAASVGKLLGHPGSDATAASFVNEKDGRIEVRAEGWNVIDTSKTAGFPAIQIARFTPKQPIGSATVNVELFRMTNPNSAVEPQALLQQIGKSFGAKPGYNVSDVEVRTLGGKKVFLLPVLAEQQGIRIKGNVIMMQGEKSLYWTQTFVPEAVWSQVDSMLVKLIENTTY